VVSVASGRGAGRVTGLNDENESVESIEGEVKRRESDREEEKEKERKIGREVGLVPSKVAPASTL